MKKWIRVSRDEPCPVCKKPDWCGISEDRKAATCMRVESNRVVANGGWLHKLTDAQLPPIITKPRPKPTVDAAKLIKQMQSDTTPEDIMAYAHDLGVRPESLSLLGAARGKHTAWAFPMVDGDGVTVGIRYRAANGRKWAEDGSRNGLFVPWFADPAPDGVAYICEGPTDTAAALSIGLWAFGRAACRGSVPEIKRHLNRSHIKRVVIIADNDEAKDRPDGTLWYPGKEGALALAKDINLPTKVIIPPCKDLRAWLLDGATLESILCIAAQMPWRKK